MPIAYTTLLYLPCIKEEKSNHNVSSITRRREVRIYHSTSPYILASSLCAGEKNLWICLVLFSLWGEICNPSKKARPANFEGRDVRGRADRRQPHNFRSRCRADRRMKSNTLILFSAIQNTSKDTT